MNKTIRIFQLTIFAFGTYFILEEVYFGKLRRWLNEFIHQYGISHIITYLVLGIPIFIGVLMIHKKEKFFESLGFNRSFLKGMLFSLLCTLPMFIGNAIVFEFDSGLTADTILITVVAAAFFEELYFRGFLFGQLFRYTNWGFIPAVLIGAVIFGLVHLYQGSSPGELAGIFAVTFAGAVLFAWAYVEWDYNIWVPVFLHAFMNLSWGLFSASDTALGGVYSNVFRAMTIALVIVLTIRYKRGKGLKLEVSKKTVWVKK
ncbi:MAG: CPBP family intramembrane metalloprotease [Eudoraea sp.]|nr:CPBP family intramembrane metalloprotease [Eudoraea sp.]